MSAALAGILVPARAARAMACRAELCYLSRPRAERR